MTDIEFQCEPLSPALIEITLKEILTRFQYNEDEIKDALSAFNQWITLPVDETGLNIQDIYDKRMIKDIWEKIRSNFYSSNESDNPVVRGFLILTDLALTFIACSATEAQCERYISKQKLCLCQCTRNINDDLLESIWLLYSHRKNIEKF